MFRAIPHFSPPELSLYIDSLRGLPVIPPPYILRHLESCKTCKKAVLELLEILKELDKKGVK